jgi:hypothetical protein
LIIVVIKPFGPYGFGVYKGGGKDITYGAGFTYARVTPNPEIVEYITGDRLAPVFNTYIFPRFYLNRIKIVFNLAGFGIGPPLLVHLCGFFAFRLRIVGAYPFFKEVSFFGTVSNVLLWGATTLFDVCTGEQLFDC